MTLEQRRALKTKLEAIAFHPSIDEDITEMLEAADIKNQEDIDAVKAHSPWQAKTSEIRRRNGIKEGWIRRFVAKEEKIKIRPDRVNLLKVWKDKAKAKADVDYTPLPELRVRNTSPREDDARKQGQSNPESFSVCSSGSRRSGGAQLLKPSNTKRTSLLTCDVCWGVVTPGSGLCCLQSECDQVAHIYCLKKHRGDHMHAQVMLDGWRCDLCATGDTYASYAEDALIHRVKKKYTWMASLHKLQATFRMWPYRRVYLCLRKGVVAVQRAYRGIIFWRTQFKAKVKQARPFRIRLHNMLVFVTRKEKEINEEGYEVTVTPDDFSEKVSIFPTSLYEQYARPRGRGPVTSSSSPPPSASSSTGGAPAEATSLNPHANIPHGGAGVEGAEGSLEHAHEFPESMAHQVKLLRHDYKEYPAYFNGVGSPFQSVKLAAPGALFLTLTLREYDWESGSERQIYRSDIPLTLQNPHNMYNNTVKELYGPNWKEHVHGGDKGLADFEHRFNSQLQVAKVNFSRTCGNILIPGMPACVDVIMTLSTVAQWPKAFIVGQQRERVTQNLIWRNLATYAHSFTPVREMSHDDVPTAEDSSKLVLYLPPQKKKKMQTNDHGGVLARLTSLPDRLLKGTEAEHGNTKTREVGGGVTWSIHPGSAEDSVHGSAVLLVEPTLTAARSRAWIVIMDRMMYLFHAVGDMHPYAAVELKHFHSCFVDDNKVIHMIRRKPPTDQYYLLLNDHSLRNVWVRVVQKLIVQH